MVTGVHASASRPAVPWVGEQSGLGLAVGTITTGAAAVAYAAGIERRRWTLRAATLPVLAPGARPLRLLHISDLHLTPGQESKKRWVAALAELEPDLVVNTGDNLAHPRAVPGVLAALDPLLSAPGRVRVRQQRLLRPAAEEPGPLPGQEPDAGSRASRCPGATCGRR